MKNECVSQAGCNMNLLNKRVSMKRSFEYKIAGMEYIHICIHYQRHHHHHRCHHKNGNAHAHGRFSAAAVVMLNIEIHNNRAKMLTLLKHSFVCH